MGVIHDYGMPFTDQAGDRKYNSAQWREYFGKLIKDGIIQNAGNEVTVKQQAVANKSVFVDTGTVFIQGVMRIASSATTLNCADNTSGNPRIDRVVARLNYTTRAIEFAVKQGTPAASPVAPALTRNTSMYELALADITLANGFSTILTANINDKRWDVNLCGAASMTIGVIPPSGMEAETVALSAEALGLYGTGNVDAALIKLNLAKHYGKYSQMSSSVKYVKPSGSVTTILVFTTEDKDDFGAINLASSYSRITIPNGISEAQFYGYIGEIQAVGADTRLRLLKNGVVLETLISVGNTSTNIGGGNFTTGPIAVSAGDYFELQFLMTQTTQPDPSIAAGFRFGMRVLK